MAPIQTIRLDKKKFAILPYSYYEKLLEQIEDLKDIRDIKKRAKEPRIPLEQAKREYLKKHK